MAHVWRGIHLGLRQNVAASPALLACELLIEGHSRRHPYLQNPPIPLRTSSCPKQQHIQSDPASSFRAFCAFRCCCGFRPRPGCTTMLTTRKLSTDQLWPWLVPRQTCTKTSENKLFQQHVRIPSEVPRAEPPKGPTRLTESPNIDRR